MAFLHCPHCGAAMPKGRSWAEVAVATLVPAPAVPDMATQMRCDACGRVSAASDLRHAVADRFHPRRLRPWLLVAAVLLWAFTSVAVGQAVRPAQFEPWVSDDTPACHRPFIALHIHTAHAKRNRSIRPGPLRAGAS